jgi:hypothetical protein
VTLLEAGKLGQVKRGTRDVSRGNEKETGMTGFTLSQGKEVNNELSNCSDAS